MPILQVLSDSVCGADVPLKYQNVPHAVLKILQSHPPGTRRPLNSINQVIVLTRVGRLLHLQHYRVMAVHAAVEQVDCAVEGVGRVACQRQSCQRHGRSGAAPDYLCSGVRSTWRRWAWAWFRDFESATAPPRKTTRVPDALCKKCRFRKECQFYRYYQTQCVGQMYH